MIPPSSSSSSAAGASTNVSSFAKPLPTHGERHVLKAETELRLEIPFNSSITLTLLAGSAEIFGVELALATDIVPNPTIPLTSSSSSASSVMMMTTMSKQSYWIPGNTKFAIFTWYGCTVDVDIEYGKSLDISYTSTETTCNISYVNTHAQLEIYREEALRAALVLQQQQQQSNIVPSPTTTAASLDGPRVLIVGPPDSGKTTLAKLLTAYAIKVGKTPILVDLDPSQNILSVPGTLSACIMTPDSISIPSYASMGLTTTTTTGGGGNTNTNSTHYPLALWYGSTEVSSQPDLYQALLYRLGQVIDARVGAAGGGVASASSADSIDTRSSGLIINTCGWIEDIGYKLLLHAISAFRINIILVMGHDRLYSMLQTHYQKINGSSNGGENGLTTNIATTTSPKVIKLPRSGGVVYRDVAFRRISRSLCIRQYFYGDLIPSSSLQSTTASSSSLIHQYSPVLLELSFANIRIYKLSSVSLTASMLPIAAKQTTDPIQLNLLTSISPSLTHSLVAVCHPNAVEAFDKSGNAADLYLSGVAGFLAIEKVNMEKDVLTVLSPCSGSLPSSVLILGDVSWME